jgi:hypothetical protein
VWRAVLLWLQAANPVERTEFFEVHGARRYRAAVENRRVKWKAVVIIRRVVLECESWLKPPESSVVKHVKSQ